MDIPSSPLLLFTFLPGLIPSSPSSPFSNSSFSLIREFNSLLIKVIFLLNSVIFLLNAVILPLISSNRACLTLLVKFDDFGDGLLFSVSDMLPKLSNNPSNTSNTSLSFISVFSFSLV